jgi:uncharacterized lipoprotein YmbA
MTIPKRIFMVILVLGLTGCAFTNKLQTIPASFSVEGKEESVVIGRMITVHGTFLGAKPLNFFDRLSSMELTVGNETTGKIFIVVCDQSGSDSNFYVALPPGRYRLAELRRSSGERQFQEAVAKVVFTSPPIGRFEVGKGQVIYIGTLKLEYRGFLHNWQVENEYEDVVKSFHERYPQMNQDIVKSLVKLE